MTKSDLIQSLADSLRHLSQAEVEVIIDTIFDKIKNALKKHHRVELRGFGIFEVRHRQARVGRNPKSGQSVDVQDRYVPFFKIGKELRERLNQELVQNDVMTEETKVAAHA